MPAATLDPRPGLAPAPAPGDAPADPRAGSAVYRGTVHHRRLAPFEHGFSYRVFAPLFDLDELPELLDPIPLWTARDGGRPSPARFRRSDHLGDPGRPLADAARRLVAERTGRHDLDLGGPVKLLANPRYWGFGMNPVAFYYLHGSDPATGVAAMIAEVTNTPWGQRRIYVLEPDAHGQLEGSFTKSMHVSPFMPMEQTYGWSASEPGERLRVTLANHDPRGQRVFEAGIALEREAITRESMLRLLASYPPMTIATAARIYWQALRLKLKGAPYYRAPDRNPDRAPDRNPDRAPDRNPDRHPERGR